MKLSCVFLVVFVAGITSAGSLYKRSHSESALENIEEQISSVTTALEELNGKLVVLTAKNVNKNALRGIQRAIFALEGKLNLLQNVRSHLNANSESEEKNDSASESDDDDDDDNNSASKNEDDEDSENVEENNVSNEGDVEDNDEDSQNVEENNASNGNQNNGDSDDQNSGDEAEESTDIPSKDEPID